MLRHLKAGTLHLPQMTLVLPFKTGMLHFHNSKQLQSRVRRTPFHPDMGSLVGFFCIFVLRWGMIPGPRVFLNCCLGPLFLGRAGINPDFLVPDDGRQEGENVHPTGGRQAGWAELTQLPSQCQPSSTCCQASGAQRCLPHCSPSLAASRSKGYY